MEFMRFLTITFITQAVCSPSQFYFYLAAYSFYLVQTPGIVNIW
jgi:hypothetical protein